ncbi:MAG: hypothetical protein NC213_05670 [Acetobacter sp.]|nr:hypothetical protein [Bacteroides sp.]MCM1341216.1 hypothetical protein [Acetobacter sp.]MCM1433859.1 hypothetical protein [Clostridiales bacterium]
MERYKKDFIKKEFVFPVITAIIAVLITAIVLCGYINTLPFYNSELKIADNPASKIKNAENIDISSVTSDTFSMLGADTNIGSLKAGGTELPLIYNASYENTNDAFCISDGSKLIGETGNTLIYCSKANGKDIRKLVKGDIITINTCYGEYTYTVVKTDTADDAGLEHNADGIGSAITLYTSKDESIGLSDSYFIAVCEMTSGTKIAE